MILPGVEVLKFDEDLAESVGGDVPRAVEGQRELFRVEWRFDIGEGGVGTDRQVGITTEICNGVLWKEKSLDQSVSY